jgi:hypothetical protein
VRLITPADEEIFQTVSLAGKLGRAAPVLEKFERRYHADPGDPDAAFGYALALTAALPSVTTDFEIHAAFGATIEVLGEVVSAVPDHWLARYCRARLRALVPSSYSVFTIHTESELAKAAADLNELLAAQSGQPARPYFASPCVLAAVVRCSAEETGTPVGDGPDRAELLAAAAGQPRARVPYPALGAMLCEPFIALHDRSTGSERDLAGDLMATMFPDQVAVKQALARQPVR